MSVRSFSGWSTATAVVDDATWFPRSESRNALPASRQELGSTPSCWRESEVRKLLQDNEADIVHCLRKFRPFSDNFASEINIDLSPFDQNDNPGFSEWTWKTYHAQRDDAETIATDLARESWSMFIQIPFQDWVREALRFEPESVDLFWFKYSELSFRLFSYLRRNEGEFHKYQEVTKVSYLSYSSSDTLLTVTSACKEKTRLYMQQLQILVTAFQKSTRN
jgi:hypothetical protein